MASSSYNKIQSSSTPTLWDVFLSFRGTDTRYTFTDHLYKALHRTGIRTFKDTPELHSGEVISDSLIQAITKSKTYIVVLSENYASSPWCLDELVQIIDCYNRLKRLVVPVFYNIDPSIVRYQLGNFKEAFEKHQTRFEMEKLNKWRLTLKQVADFSGYHISKNRSQADIIDEVVDRILLETNPMTLDVARYPVGLDSRVKDVTTLFNIDTEGVIRIGIHGMGGVGKTTLAKAVYNQNYQRFQGSSFLSNVREVSRTKGLVCLQQQLINDVLKRKDVQIDSVDQGIEMIRSRICSNNVLVVIDDLDNPKPLKYLEGSFALGSMVIITTRNEDLLDRIGVKAKYKVNQMDKYESLQLFTRHAFGENKVSDTFKALSKEILKRAGGLPLALQVFGSTLLNESEEGWRWFIDKLKRAPIDDVEENLMISFDALKSVDPNLQDIFLDIAAWYIGWKKEEVAKILGTCYMFVNRSINILKKRCLITINDEDEHEILGMHDLLRDMGREIARNNSPYDPGKHSRLWVLQDIHRVLKEHKGTEAIQGIISSNYHHRNENALDEGVPFTFIQLRKSAPDEGVSYSAQTLKRMRKIALAEGESFSAQTYKRMRKIALDEGVSFSAQTFKWMSKLRFLYLNNVYLTGSFEHIFEDLRWLCWKRCPLECLPSEFYAQKLVTLELPDSKMRTMWGLNMVPQVFDNLKTLNMSYSSNLTTTPDFTRLPCLETLNLRGCSSLEEVHISIGCLVRLVSLNLGYCGNLRRLPDSICRLRALEVLAITGCSSLEALPIELGNIESLKVLDASGLSILRLPDSVGRLSNLVKMNLYQSENLVTLPDSIGNLRSLEILEIHLCKKLEELPDQLGMITNLRKLNVNSASMLKKLPDISQLTEMEDIDLSDCHHLLSIAELPPNLKGIKALNCRTLKRFPDLSNLIQLRKLDLRGCHALTEIQDWEEAGRCTYYSGLTEIQGLDELTSLRKLYSTASNTSLLTNTSAKHLFQILSGFGHKIEIYIDLKHFPNWMGQFQIVRGSTILSLDLQPTQSHNFLGIIFCFCVNYGGVKYWAKNITSGFVWSDNSGARYSDDGLLFVIVPTSIFPITDGDFIELASEDDFYRVHLMYKTDIRSEYDSANINVEEGIC